MNRPLTTIILVGGCALLVLTLIALTGLPGAKRNILPFGDDIELCGPAFDQPKLDQISQLTGVTFPAGTEGMEFFFSGSGIDDSLAAKVRIPSDTNEEFMANAVFSSGEPSIHIGGSKPWWKPDSLTGKTERSKNLPNAQLLEIVTGREGDQVIAYLTWHTM